MISGIQNELRHNAASMSSMILVSNAPALHIYFPEQLVVLAPDNAVVKLRRSNLPPTLWSGQFFIQTLIAHEIRLSKPLTMIRDIQLLRMIQIGPHEESPRRPVIIGLNAWEILSIPRWNRAYQEWFAGRPLLAYSAIIGSAIFVMNVWFLR